jgi:CheY-like chemotaxis protein
MEPSCREMFVEGRPGILPDDILIVEDDLIIALDMEEAILRLGARAVRIATSVPAALEMIAVRPPDFALLNVNLGNETSLTVAERLHNLDVRFGFVTGHGARDALLARFADKPRIDKPFSIVQLKTVLENWTAR